MITAQVVVARNSNQEILQGLSQLRMGIAQDGAARDSDASSQ
jgi:hypothetical protein